MIEILFAFSNEKLYPSMKLICSKLSLCTLELQDNKTV